MIAASVWFKANFRLTAATTPGAAWAVAIRVTC